MNLKILFSVKSLVVLAIICTMLACEKKSKSKREYNLKSIVEKNLGKKIILPDNLKSYSSFPNIIADSLEMSFANYKIYTHINVSCSTCIDGIKKWDSLVPQFIRLRTAVFLICSSEDNFELIKNIFESNYLEGFSYPIFLDKKNEFVEKNPFMKESVHFETVLTDNNNNNIILMGNPIYSEKTKELYFSEISKKTNSNNIPKKQFEGLQLK